MGWRDERPDLGKSFDPPACPEPAWRPEVARHSEVAREQGKALTLPAGFVIWALEPVGMRPVGPVHVFSDRSMGSWPDKVPTIFPTVDAAVEQIVYNARVYADRTLFTVRRACETTVVTKTTRTTYEVI